jgi:hypothetical protein
MALTEEEAARIVVSEVRANTTGRKEQAALAAYISEYSRNILRNLGALSAPELRALCAEWVREFKRGSTDGPPVTPPPSS